MSNANKSTETEIAMFLGTLEGLTTAEALANLEADARSYGWSRQAVRKAASTIRLRAAGPRNQYRSMVRDEIRHALACLAQGLGWLSTPQPRVESNPAYLWERIRFNLANANGALDDRFG